MGRKGGIPKMDDEKYKYLFENMLDAFALNEIIYNSDGKPVDYRFIEVNPAFEKLTGLKAESIKNKRVKEVLTKTENYWIENYGNVVLTGKAERFEEYSAELDKYFKVNAYKTSENRFAVVFHDITQEKKTEIEKDFTVQLFQFINSPDGLNQFMKNVIGLFKSFTGCDAVGIRLKEGDDYPYYETDGFSKKFILKENRLCVRDSNGNLLRQKDGEPVLECMCGNVIQGRFNPELPFFTMKGSFWSNCTTDLLASTSEEDRQAHTRNYCNKQGYESVALIPLRTGIETFGLLQFNDKREGRFNLDKIMFLEQIADYFALGLAKRKSDILIKESEEKYRKLFSTSQQGVLYLLADGNIVDANPAASKILGIENRILCAKNIMNGDWKVINNDGVQIEPGKFEGVIALKNGEGFYNKEIGIYNYEQKDYVWLLINAFPEYKEEDNSPYRFVITMQDITDRKKTENELYESKKFLEGVTGMAPDVIYLYHIQQQRHLYFNREMMELLGYPSEEIENKGAVLLLNEIHPDDLPDVLTHMEIMREAEDNMIYQIEYRIKRKNGDYIWLYTREKVYLRDKANKPVIIFGVMQDITDRKNAVNALRQSEESARAILNSITDVALLITPEGIVIDTNDELAKHLDFDKEEIIGKVIYDYFEPKIAALRKSKIDWVVKSGMKVRYIEERGEKIADNSLYPIFDTNGNVSCVAVFGKDITETKLAEQALKESEEKYRRIVETASEGIWMMDEKYRTTFVNKRMEEMLGYKAEEIMGKKVTDFMFDEDINDHNTKMIERKIGLSKLYERRFRKKDGNELWTIVSGTPIQDAHNNFKGSFGMFTDITENKKAGDALRISEEKYHELYTMLRLMSDTMPDMLWAKDLNKQYIFANKALCNNLLNVSDTSEPVGKTDLFFAERERNRHPEFPAWHTFGELCMDSDDITLKELKEMQFDEFGNVKGRLLYLDVRKAPLYNYEGKLIGIVGSARDVTGRKKAEEALRESEFSFKGLFNSVLEAIYIQDENGIFLDANEGAEKMLGYDKEFIIGKSPLYFSVDGMNDLDALKNAISSAFEGEKQQFEFWARKKNGEIFPQDVLLYNSKYYGKSVVIAFVQDISERKKTEMSLKESESRYRSIFDDSPLAIWEEDFSIIKSRFDELSNGGIRDFRKYFEENKDEVVKLASLVKIKEMNKASFKILGVDKIEKNIGLKDLFTDDSYNVFNEEIISLAEGKTFFNAERPGINLKGENAIFEIHLTVQPGYEESLSRVLVTFADITGRKEIEEKIKLLNKRLETMISVSPLAVVVMDADENVLVWNNAAEKLFGYTAGEVIGKPLMIIPDEKYDEYKIWSKKVAQGISIANEETYRKRKDGKLIPVAISTAALGEKTGINAGRMAIFSDISERKKNERIMNARFSLITYSQNHSTDELLTETLDVIEKITGSNIGFYHFVNDDQKTLSLQNWSTNTLGNMCTAEGKGTHYDIEKAGVWTDCIHQMKPVIHNDVKSLPHLKGMPEGHAPVYREAVVPIFRGDKIVAIIGVGNKPEEYNENDIEMISQIADLSWDIIDKKRSEEEVLSQKNLLNSIFESSPYIIALIDKDMKLVTINKVGENFTGGNSKEFINYLGNDVLNCVNTSKEDGCTKSKDCAECPIRNSISYTLKTGISNLNVESKIILSSDGEEREYYLMISTTMVKQKNAELVLLTLVDITDRKNAEEAVQTSEKRLSRAQQIAHVGNWELNLKTKKMWASEEAFRIYGFDRTMPELPLEYVQKSVLAQYRPKLDAALKGLIEQTGGYNLEFQIKKNDTGEIRYVHSMAELVKNSLGEKVAVLGVIQDITSRKRAEESVILSEKRLRRALTIAHAGNWELNMSTNKMWASDEAWSIYGVKQESGIMPFFNSQEMALPEYMEKINNSIKRLMDEGGEFNEEFEIKRVSDGEIRNIHSMAEIVRNEEGEALVIQGVVQDVTERTRMTAELRESEERYRLLVELSPDALLIHQNGTIMYVNPAALHLFGAKEQSQLVGSKLINRVHPDFRDIVKKRVDKIDKSGKLVPAIEEKLLKLDGSEVDVEVIASPFIFKGEPAVQVIARDISERNIFVRALQVSEERFRHISTTISDIAYSCVKIGESYQLDWLTGAAQNVTGYSNEEIINKKCWGFLVVAEDKILFDKNVIGLMPGQASRTELRIHKKNGELAWVISFAECIIEKSRQGIHYLYGGLVNITERKVIERALVESEERFRTLIKNVPDGIELLDMDGRILLVNSATCTQLGYTEEELLRMTVFDINPDSTPEEFKEENMNLKLTGHIYKEAIHKRKDGSRFPAEITKDQIQIGGFSRLLVTRRDITDRKRTEMELDLYRNHLEEIVKERTAEIEIINEKLIEEIEKEREIEIMLRESLSKEKELNELKNRFISTASHEFKTPLTTIMSSVELIQRYGRTWDEIKLEKHITRIQGSVDHLSKLIDDVLTISRSENGKLQNSPIIIDLCDLCSKYLEEVKLKATPKHEFIFNFNSKDRIFNLDPRLMRFIVINLLSNAIKYSPDGGTVELNVNIDSDKITIKVADKGIGISFDDEKHLYEPFFRAKNALEFEGTGLGLSIVKRAVEVLGGEIRIKSKPEKGTTFEIIIPRR